MPPTHPSQAAVAAAYRTLIAHETAPKEQDFYRDRLQRLEQATEPECELDCRNRIAAAGVGVYCPKCSAKCADTDLTTELAKAIRAAWVDRLNWDELAHAALKFLTAAGRLIPAGGMTLTAEQVLDLKNVLDHGHPMSAQRLVDALFPATEPAEVNGNIFAEGNSSPTVVHVHHHDIEAHAASFNEGYEEAVRQFTDPTPAVPAEDIESLIEKSSLGTEAAQAAIDTVSPEHGRLIVAIAEQRAKTEALAKFIYEHGNPELSEEDRGILGPWEAMDEVTQKIWINLADAAYIHIADEIDSEKELLSSKVDQLQAQVKHLSRVAVNAAEHGIPTPAEPAEEETNLAAVAQEPRRFDPAVHRCLHGRSCICEDIANAARAARLAEPAEEETKAECLSRWDELRCGLDAGHAGSHEQGKCSDPDWAIWPGDHANPTTSAEPIEEEAVLAARGEGWYEGYEVGLEYGPIAASGEEYDGPINPYDGPASSPVGPAPTETGTNPVGLTDKYIVRRVDGSDAEGCRNFGRRYFVLSYDSDPHARSALAAYAASCETDYPELAADLRARLGENEPAAPTETEWQTWREVPEGRTVRSANGERFRKNSVGAIHLLTNGVGDCCQVYAEVNSLPAPFFAVKEES